MALLSWNAYMASSLSLWRETCHYCSLYGGTNPHEGLPFRVSCVSDHHPKALSQTIPVGAGLQHMELGGHRYSACNRPEPQLISVLTDHLMTLGTPGQGELEEAEGDRQTSGCAEPSVLWVPGLKHSICCNLCWLPNDGMQTVLNCLVGPNCVI